MRRTASAIIAASLLIGTPATLVMIDLLPTPSAAQVSFSVSFNYFYNALAPYGRWYHHPRWGDVWQPFGVGRDFRPYYDGGYWRDTTDYGWIWVSDYEWGYIPFHYGRWVYDPRDGWIWVPGYVWGPGWVIWRGGDGYLGWFPMPPTDSFLIGLNLYQNNWFDWDRCFGYTDWYGPEFGPSWSLSYWTFVDDDDFGDRDFHRHVVPRHRVMNILRHSNNLTHYVDINNYIVNRSINTRQIERESGRHFTPVPARDVIHRAALITGFDLGREVHSREQHQHGGNPSASPRGRLTELRPSEIRTPEVTGKRPPPSTFGGPQQRRYRGVYEPNVNPPVQPQEGVRREQERVVPAHTTRPSIERERMEGQRASQAAQPHLERGDGRRVPGQHDGGPSSQPQARGQEQPRGNRPAQNGTARTGHEQRGQTE